MSHRVLILNSFTNSELHVADAFLQPRFVSTEYDFSRRTAGAIRESSYLDAEHPGLDRGLFRAASRPAETTIECPSSDDGETP